MGGFVPYKIDHDYNLSADVVVVGSGAGGATTARMLSEAGLDVIVLEEGGHYTSTDFKGGVADLIDKLYRDGGVSPVIGRPNIPYGEGRCVGGTTVINGGVYWRTPPKALARWTRDMGLPQLDEASLAPHFDVLADDLGVKYHAEPHANHASDLLAQGSEKLGWRWSQVPRAQKGCQNSNRCPTGCPNDAKQSMLLSYIPDAIKNGARLIVNAKVDRIIFKNTTATGVEVTHKDEHGRTRQLSIRARAIFSCAGAMQTPFLLRKSGIKHNVGSGLHLHLNLKAIAVFPHDINPAAGSIMSKQVKEYDDRDIYIASSTFDPVYLALALAPHGQLAVEKVMAQWKRSSIYVAQIKAEGTGHVHVLPGMNRPLPSYSLTKGDIANIRLSIEKLGEVLLASGAREVYLPVAGSGAISQKADVRAIAQGRIDPRALDIVTVHAMASCRLGQALDAYGKVKDVNGLYVNDASMLPESPGVSPQMTIMGVARRNLVHFLEQRGRA